MSGISRSKNALIKHEYGTGLMMASLLPSLLAKDLLKFVHFSGMIFEVTQSCFTRCVVGIFYEFAPLWDKHGRGART